MNNRYIIKKYIKNSTINRPNEERDKDKYIKGSDRSIDDKKLKTARKK